MKLTDWNVVGDALKGSMGRDEDNNLKTSTFKIQDRTYLLKCSWCCLKKAVWVEMKTTI